MSEDQMQLPRRRHMITIEVGADSYKELCDRVDEIATEMSLKGDSDHTMFNVVSGSGWYTTHVLNASATAESYQRDLREYLSKKRSTAGTAVAQEAGGEGRKAR